MTKLLRKIRFTRVLVTSSAVLMLLGGGASAQEKPMTLDDCYRSALRQSEVVAVQGERIRQAEAHFLQALGTVLPNVSFSSSRLYQDSESAGNRERDDKFVFTQEIFAGFKHFASLSAGKLEKKQRQSEKLRAEQLLFMDVADAFYLLVEQREDLKTLQAVKKAFIDRIEELKRREFLGKSRRSEVVSTETQLYTLEDQIQSVRSREEVARQLLEFLTGCPVGELAEQPARYELKAIEEYAVAAQERPDVKAAGYAWETAKRGVTVAKSGFWPTITAEGNYFNRRSSAPRDSDWQGLLKINFPIFEGTTTLGDVKEARAVAKQNELIFQRAGRDASREVSSAYAFARYAFLRVAVLEKAVKSAELNYSLQEKDYKLNIVNNLDVLAALQSLQELRRTYNRMYYESRRAYWQLRAAAGDIAVDKYR